MPNSFMLLRGFKVTEELLEHLAVLAKHEDSEVRYIVVDMLEIIGGLGSISILKGLLNDPVSTIREMATESLKELGGPGWV